jgi:hypothetical protein
MLSGFLAIDNSDVSKEGKMKNEKYYFAITAKKYFQYTLSSDDVRIF